MSCIPTATACWLGTVSPERCGKQRRSKVEKVQSATVSERTSPGAADREALGFALSRRVAIGRVVHLGSEVS
jgi:hypothetical protein